MSNDNREQTVLEQFGHRRLYPQNRLFTGRGQSAACAVHPVAPQSLFSTQWVDPLPGCCMFATGLITQDSENRTCSLTDCFCPAKAFKEPKVFLTCPSRTEDKEKPKEHH